jgi:serine/threonine-protein kinase RsbW
MPKIKVKKKPLPKKTVHLRQEAPVVSIRIPAISEYVGVARLAVSGVASRLNFSIDQIEDIKVAVTEACANAVQYAYCKHEEGSPDKKVEVTCSAYPDHLEIVIKDNGCGFDPENPPKPDKSDGHTHLGLGLTFMKTLMDKAAIRSHKGKGTEVTLIKYVAPTRPA